MDTFRHALTVQQVLSSPSLNEFSIYIYLLSNYYQTTVYSICNLKSLVVFCVLEHAALSRIPPEQLETHPSTFTGRKGREERRVSPVLGQDD